MQEMAKPRPNPRKTATVRKPIARAERMTRQAISPRLAIRSVRKRR